MSISTFSPEACYLTKPNISHPGTSTQSTAAESAGRTEIATRLGVTTVTGGAIKQGRQMPEYSSPEATYLTKQDSSGHSNIGWPSTQALATAAEATARTDIQGRNNLASVTGNSITLAR